MHQLALPFAHRRQRHLAQAFLHSKTVQGKLYFHESGVARSRQAKDPVSISRSFGRIGDG
jgi:hypothetical protein